MYPMTATRQVDRILSGTLLHVPAHVWIHV
jgi:hypothetical protein